MKGIQMRLDGKIFKNKLVQCDGWYGVVKHESGDLMRGARVIAFSVSYWVHPDDMGVTSDTFVEPVFQMHDDGSLEMYGLERPDGCIEYNDSVFQGFGHLKAYVEKEDAKLAIVSGDGGVEHP